MTLENENSVKKLVGMLIEVLHGEYSDTRDLAVVQLAILGEKAVPYISAYLEELADKVNDMIKYDELYTDYMNARANGETKRAKNALSEYATVLIAKWGITKSWRVPEWIAGSSTINKWIREEIEKKGRATRDAVQGVLKALSIIGDRRVIPLLRRLPIYRFHYEYYGISLLYDGARASDRPPLFEKVKETIDIIQNSQ